MSHLRKTLVVVLGMHRSGTSALARSLLALGIPLGDNLMPAAPDNNDKGFWEDVDVHQLNESLLSALGYRWDSVESPALDDYLSPVVAEFHQRAVALLSTKLNSHRIFGLKDPRLTRLLPFWQLVFAELDLQVIYLLALRNPRSVAESLWRRDAKPRADTYALWESYMGQAAASLVADHMLVVDYDAMLANPEQQLARIAAATGRPFNADDPAVRVYVGEFLDAQLRHGSYGDADFLADATATLPLVELYRTLQTIADDSPGYPAQCLPERMTSSPGTRRLAVVVHLFYEDIWPEIAASLQAVPQPFDLFVTVPIDKEILLSLLVRASCPNAKVIALENRGRDVAPFVYLLPRLIADHYELVCKLHSKRSAHALAGDQWRRDLYAGLLGSPEHVAAVIRAFDAQPNVGLLTPTMFRRSLIDSMEGNYPTVSRLLRQLGEELTEEEWFAAGTMFWCRPQALEPLLGLVVASYDFEVEHGQLDGTLAHAIERLFPAIVKAAGYVAATFESADPGHLKVVEPQVQANFCRNSLPARLVVPPTTAMFALALYSPQDSMARPTIDETALRTLYLSGFHALCFFWSPSAGETSALAVFLETAPREFRFCLCISASDLQSATAWQALLADPRYLTDAGVPLLLIAGQGAGEEGLFAELVTSVASGLPRSPRLLPVGNKDYPLLHMSDGVGEYQDSLRRACRIALAQVSTYPPTIIVDVSDFVTAVKKLAGTPKCPWRATRDTLAEFPAGELLVVVASSINQDILATSLKSSADFVCQSEPTAAVSALLSPHARLSQRGVLIIGLNHPLPEYEQRFHQLGWRRTYLLVLDQKITAETNRESLIDLLIRIPRHLVLTDVNAIIRDPVAATTALNTMLGLDLSPMVLADGLLTRQSVVAEPMAVDTPLSRFRRALTELTPVVRRTECELEIQTLMEASQKSVIQAESVQARGLFTANAVVAERSQKQIRHLMDLLEQTKKALADRERRIHEVSVWGKSLEKNLESADALVRSYQARLDELSAWGRGLDQRLLESDRLVIERGAVIGSLEGQITVLERERLDAESRLIEVHAVHVNAIADLNQKLQEHKDLSEAAMQRMRQTEAEMQRMSEAEMQRMRQTEAEMQRMRQSEVLLQQVMASHSWRLTRPLRVVMRLMRYGVRDTDRLKLLEYLRWCYRRLPLPQPLTRALRSAVYRVFAPPPIATSAVSTTPNGPLLDWQRPSTPDYFVWGVIDWHFRHQRPQHIAEALAASGRRVFYISAHLRHAEHDGYEIESIDNSSRLFQVQLYARGAPTIYFGAPSAETLAQLRAGLGQLLHWTDTRSVVSFIQHPFWLDVATTLPNCRVLYDCMDHHEGFDNTATEVTLLEKKLLAQADATIVTSRWLYDTVAGQTKQRAIVRNATEYEHFANRPAEIFSDTKGRPIIGYYGAIAEWFDQDLVDYVATQFPDCLVLLIGADTVNAAGRLRRNENVLHVPEVPYSTLPHYLHAFDVCLLPFRITPLTLATNPVKVYEYLSAGKPVVSVNLPEMAQFEDVVTVAGDRERFCAAIAAYLAAPLAQDESERKTFARGQTWDHRIKDIVSVSEAPALLPSVSIVVVTFNNLELTKACLYSLAQYSDYPQAEIIVVDNASTDGTPAYLETWLAENPATRQIILNANNTGFAAANNQGLRAASGDYLVLLNNDTFVTPGWLGTLLKHLRSHPELGLIGPVTNNIGNEARIPIGYTNMDGMIREAQAYTRAHLGQTIPLRTAAFFCVAFSREVYEVVGELDEVFGIGFFEDDDYCRRIEKHGWQIRCAEDVFIHHHLSASFNKVPSATRQELFERNKAIYEQKWGPWIPHTYRSSATDA